MSIVKDLLLISLFLFIVINYILLHREFFKQRRYFIDSLSHDLRVSAIAQIRGIELLRKNSDTPNEIIENLLESSNFSLEMINMLLNSYKYQTGEKFLSCEYFSQSELMGQICNELIKKAEEKRIKIIHDIDKETTVFADKAGIYKVLTTLISTAILNSYNNKLIHIKLENSSRNIKTTITYQGKTLTEEECKRMFFETPRFSTVGQGIKMHLAKKIIDFHNGKIKVQRINKELNSFCFIIPKNKRKTDEKPQLLSILPIKFPQVL